MRRLVNGPVVVVLTVLSAWIALQTRAAGQVSARSATVMPRTVEDLRQWDSTVDSMVRGGELRLRRAEQDTLIAGRVHERLDQFSHGVRIFGGDLTRQVDRGQTVSIFGVLYADLNLDTTPGLDAVAAQAAIERLSGAARPGVAPELVILPTPSGTYALTYTEQIWTDTGPVVYFVDATTGAEVWHYNNLQTQSAVRSGKGVLADDKKVSMLATAGTYLADDQLRPPTLRTFNLNGNLTRTKQFLNNVITLGSSDVAASSAEPWTDGAAVDAQVYQGWVYDYYFKRFGRRGLDNNNSRVLGIVHPALQSAVLQASSSDQDTFWLNAFYVHPGVMVYGEGLPSNLTVSGQHWTYLAGGLDVICHELSHGVTAYTSNLIYQNESGALNEAFSDMMGTSCEFFYASVRGKTGNYLIGEDVVTPGGLRSMADPRAYGDPDHFAIRYTGTQDHGGVHTNSGIGNNAFYLAIEGGRNRTSGLAVTGVGSANREQIEKTFYRAFAQLMPSNATFAVARRATIQAAQDLYGAGSQVVTAVTQAWTAVGVN
ncbi:MAG: M4 family metallopeptidase [Acidobacteria bacterium]|nr:M4 family metallopeptidase [Acidobacteriota bacterium]